jgi:hypothetical protein
MAAAGTQTTPLAVFKELQQRRAAAGTGTGDLERQQVRLGVYRVCGCVWEVNCLHVSGLGYHPVLT